MYWVLYLLIVVPASTIPIYVLSMEPERLILLPVSLVAAFALFGLIYTVPAIRLPHIKTGSLLFWVLVGDHFSFVFMVISSFGLPKGPRPVCYLRSSF